MTGIAPGGRGESAVSTVVAPRSGAAAERILDAVTACAARWGIEKTTVDDIAREAGVSRATVYRLFPGGKDVIVDLATNRQAVGLVVAVRDGVEGTSTLAEALVGLITTGARLLEEEPAMGYMRAHEPATLRRFLSFRHLDGLLELTADLLAPSLHAHLDRRAARETVIWGARLVISYFLSPDPGRELTDHAVATELVRSRVLPGLRVAGTPVVVGAAAGVAADPRPPA